MRMVSKHGEHVYLEFIRRKVEIEYVLVFWSSVHASKQYPYIYFPQVSRCYLHKISLCFPPVFRYYAHGFIRTHDT